VLDREKGVARLAKPTERLKNYTVKLQPMLGCIATAPPGHQSFRTGYLGSYGGNMVRRTIQAGAGALLDEDSRYVPCTATGFGPRVKYALISPYMARSRTGSRKVSIAAIGALIGGAFISRTWQPPSTSHPSNALSVIASTAGTNAGISVAREFFPNVLHGWLWH